MSRNKRSATVWYSDGLAFECTQCGQCCSGAPGFVWVDDQEIQALSKAMAMDVDAFERKFVRQVGAEKSLVEYPDGDCIFLEPTSRHCLVYDARPTQCRTWPFWNSNLETPKDWQQAGKSCPGCDRGRVYAMAEIEFRRSQKDV